MLNLQKEGMSWEAETLHEQGSLSYLTGYLLYFAFILLYEMHYINKLD